MSTPPTMTSFRLQIYCVPEDWKSPSDSHPLGGSPFAYTLEEALAALNRLPGLYSELDGSFLWRPAFNKTEAPGQVDGMVYDRTLEIDGELKSRVIYWELAGQLDPSAWKTLLDVFSFRQDSSAPNASKLVGYDLNTQSLIPDLTLLP